MILLAKISTGIVACMFVTCMLLQFVRVRAGKLSGFLVGSVFVICMVLIAYSSWLGTGSDISRYYSILNGLEGKSFAWAMKNGTYKNTILTNAFFWLIAQTGNNHLLPAVSTFLILINIIYFIRLETKRDTLEPSTQITYVILYLAVASFAAVMTGVRQDWMISVFAIALHRDVVQQKRGVVTILLYAASCMIHNSALLLIIVRLASLVRGWVRYIFLGWGVLIPYAERFTSLEGIFGEAADKLNKYQGVQDLDIRNILARTLMTAMLLVVLLWMKRKDKQNRYYGFMETLMIFCFGSVGVQHMYARLLTATSVLSLPLLADFKKRVSASVWSLFLGALMFICVGLFAYQFTLIRNYWVFR